MNLFHRHLLLRHVKTCGTALAVLLAVLLLSAVPRFLVAGRGDPHLEPIAIGNAAQTFGWALSTTLPIALLLGTLFTVGDLARYQELTALEAAGWSQLRILWPLLLVALVATVFLAALQFAGWASAPGTKSVDGHGVPGVLIPLSAAEDTDRHARSAYPLVGILAVVTAIPLAWSWRRVTVYSKFGTALLVLVVYYVVTATFHALGRQGGLPPAVAGWLGPALMSAAALMLWVRRKR